MRVAFLLAFERSPFAGSVRSVINLAKSLFRVGHETEIITYRTGEPLAGTLSAEVPTVHATSLEDIAYILSSHGHEYLVVDDYVKRLQLVRKLRGSLPRIRIVVYCQVLYGPHLYSLPLSDGAHWTRRSKYTIARPLLHRLLRKYRELLQGIDCILANSEFTSNLLHTIYGIEPVEVLCPPVDTEIFKPVSAPDGGPKILLYLGTGNGDADTKLIRMIVAKTSQIRAFGSQSLSRYLPSHHLNPDDMELVKLYSESTFTALPLSFELFGFVPIESMSCGTPCVAYRYQGPRETIIDGETGWLVFTREQFLTRIGQLIENPPTDEIREKCRKHVIENFGLEVVGSRFVRVLRSLD